MKDDGTIRAAEPEEIYVDEYFEVCDATTTINVVKNAPPIVVSCGLRRLHVGLHYSKECMVSWDPAKDASKGGATGIYREVASYAGTEAVKEEHPVVNHFHDEILLEEKLEKIRALRTCIEAMMPYIPETAVGKMITRLALALVDITQSDMPL